MSFTQDILLNYHTILYNGVKKNSMTNMRSASTYCE